MTFRSYRIGKQARLQVFKRAHTRSLARAFTARIHKRRLKIFPNSLDQARWLYFFFVLESTEHKISTAHEN